jgi:DNA mismatch repair ATPase MutL
MDDTDVVGLTSAEDSESQSFRKGPEVTGVEQAMDVGRPSTIGRVDMLAESSEGPAVSRTSSSSSPAISEAEGAESEETTDVTGARLASKPLQQTTLDSSGTSWALNQPRTTSTSASTNEALKNTSSRRQNRLSLIALNLRSKFAADTEKRPDKESDIVRHVADLGDQDKVVEEATTISVEYESDVRTETEGEAADLGQFLSSTLTSRPGHLGIGSTSATASEHTLSSTELTTLETVSHRTLRDEVVADTAGDSDVTVSFDLDAIRSRWQSQRRPPANVREASVPLSRHVELEAAAISGDAHIAEETLTRMVSQDDFQEMEVLGQFNLGFIVARRRSGGANNGKPEDEAVHDDLFIIDQHASDEVSCQAHPAFPNELDLGPLSQKYNFETLQRITKIQSQRLLAYAAKAMLIVSIVSIV